MRPIILFTRIAVGIILIGLIISSLVYVVYRHIKYRKQMTLLKLITSNTLSDRGVGDHIFDFSKDKMEKKWTFDDGPLEM